MYLSVCFNVYLPFYLSACLNVYLPVYLSACLNVYLLFYLYACLNVSLPVYLSACLIVYLLFYLSASLNVYLPVYLSLYMSAVYWSASPFVLLVCLLVCMFTCLPFLADTVCLSVHLSTVFVGQRLWEVGRHTYSYVLYSYVLVCTALSSFLVDLF